MDLKLAARSICSLEGQVERLLVTRIPDELQTGMLASLHVLLDKHSEII